MFHDLLDGSPGSARSRRRLSAPLFVAAGLHGVGLLLVLGARFARVEEPSDPEIPVVFIVSRAPEATGGDAKPAALGARRPADSRESPRRLSERIPTEARIPSETRIAEGPPVPEPSPADGGGDGDTNSGGPTGSPVGTPGGTGAGPGIGPGSGESGPGGIFQPGGAVSSPVLILRIEPEYPEMARRIHAEGTVALEAVISAMGAVEDVRVIKGTQPLLDAAALRAVERWRYRPARLDGRSVRVYLAVTVTFTLR